MVIVSQPRNSEFRGCLFTEGLCSKTTWVKINSVYPHSGFFLDSLAPSPYILTAFSGKIGTFFDQSIARFPFLVGIA